MMFDGSVSKFDDTMGEVVKEVGRSPLFYDE